MQQREVIIVDNESKDYRQTKDVEASRVKEKRNHPVTKNIDNKPRGSDDMMYLPKQKPEKNEVARE